MHLSTSSSINLTAKRSDDRKTLLPNLLQLPACTLITTGRTGTDFLQSLVDSHPQVLTFNGVFHYYDFWVHSKCVNAGKFCLSDFMDEFFGHFIEKFKSRYDLQERKDQLGENRDQSLDIDLKRFKQIVSDLLEDQDPNSRNILVSIYAAYAVCLGQDLSQKKIFLHHVHHAERLGCYLKDFPESKIICMTRDPRANFVSGILNWRKYDVQSDVQSHLTYYIDRILNDADVLKNVPNSYVVIRLEDLGQKEILDQLCQWLGIEYHGTMTRSTWGGLLWHADRLSTKEKESQGFSKNILQNNWAEKLWDKDKYVLNYLMVARLKHYGYPHKEIGILDSVLVLFLILFPLKFEWHYWSPGYIKQCLRDKGYKKIILNCYYYLRRLRSFYRHYFKTLTKVKCRHPLLRADEKILSFWSVK